MKLLTLEIISEFRNLKDLILRFDSSNDADDTNYTYVIIGNNGTGKTNILEALSSVFSTLLNHSTDFMFSFVLRYKINDITYRIKHDKATKETNYMKDNVVVEDADMIYPNRIVCNYSGEDTRMWDNYYKKAYEEYLKSVRTADAPKALSMIYIDKTMWKYILLCMLIKRGDYNAFDNFLKEKLGILSDSLISINLTFNTAKLKRWQKKNSTTLFIDQLCASFGNCPKISSYDISKFNPNDDDARLLFNKYMGANQVIDTLNISFNGGIESAYLSEGEKKMMVILFILEAISDEQTLVLMDEPDSHIHISRKSELREMFEHMSNRNNIITSHSPTLTASFEEKTKGAIVMLDKDKNGKTKVIDKDIVNIVERLTSGIWTSQKQNLFLASHDDILIVEGPTDETFISAALKYFKKRGRYTNLSFEFIPCGGASNVKAFAQKFTPKDGQTVIAFFDGDNAGIKSMSQVIPCTLDGKKWDIKNFGKARKHKNTWFSFYPPYAHRKNKENFNIEDYFTCQLFRKYILSFSSLDTIRGKDGLKSKLEDDCKKNEINERFYEKFSTLFDHIVAIKEAEEQGNVFL
jgi:hypothetical protein